MHVTWGKGPPGGAARGNKGQKKKKKKKDTGDKCVRSIAIAWKSMEC